MESLGKCEMSADDIDPTRRRFLTATTAVIGGLGALCAAFPFAASWMPSDRAKAMGAPVEVDLSKIEVGQKVTVAWRGQPIFVVHRSHESVETLSGDEGFLRDPLSLESVQPLYTKNRFRSIKEQYLILVGICTHLGCVPLFKPTAGELDASWPGGFFCPCHGSKYDMAGRVYQGVPAPLNLPVPPYRYLSDTVVLIGEDSVGAAA